MAVEAKVVGSVTGLGRMLQKAGPYVLLEILLPGGTLFALMLYLYRRGQLPFVDNAFRAGKIAARAVGDAFEPVSLALHSGREWGVSAGRRRESDGLEPLEMLAPAGGDD
jgi:hypothetical protein